MKKINALLYLIIAVGILSSCKKDFSLHVSTQCSSIPADSSAANPKNNLYQGLLDTYRKRGIPGLNVIVYSPATGLWAGASGMAKIENKISMQPCNQFYVGSIAKTYTATLCMLLKEQGLLDLDKRINTYLPSSICDKLKNGNTATVRQLLNHTSGIADYVSSAKYTVDIFNDPFADYNPDKYLEYANKMNAAFDAGTDYSYSNTNYLLLAKIIDKVSGKDHALLMKQLIFDKLSLTNSMYSPGHSPVNTGNIANGYMDRFNDGRIENVTSIINHLQSTYIGDDGLVSDPYDMFKFLHGLINNQLVQAGTLTEMKTWVHKNDKPNTPEYGLGLKYRSTSFGDAFGGEGTNGGFSADMWYYFDKNVYVISCMNSGQFPSSHISDLYKEFLDDIAEAAMG